MPSQGPKRVVRRLTLYRADLPFRFSFGHAAQARRVSDTLFLEIEDEAGRRGWGEAAPREYVTGETSSAVFAELEARLPALLGRSLPADPDALGALVDELGLGPNGRCALELGCLDLLGHQLGRSAGELLGPPRRTFVPGSAVLPLQRPALVAPLLLAVRAWALAAVKLKAGRTAARDAANLRLARRLLPMDASLRLDANMAWTAAETLDRVSALDAFGLDAVEQPVASIPELAVVRRSLAKNVALVADESFVTEGDLAQILAVGAADQLQIKIAKHGGILPSLALAERAAAAGLGVRLGCHVGESSILTAAGRVFAAQAPPLLSVENGFGPVLLAKDVARPSLGLPRGGRIDTSRSGPGWGLRISASDVARCAAATRIME